MTKHITNLLLILVTILVTSTSYSQGRKQMGLKGDVNYFEENLYSASENRGEVIKGEYIDYKYYSFNSNGDRVIISQKNPNGKEMARIFTIEFVYDGRKLIKTIYTSFSDNSTRIHTLKKESDKYSLWEIETPIETYHAKSFKKVNNIAITKEIKNGKVYEVQTNKFNKDNNIVEAIIKRDGRRVFKVKYKYNNDHFKSEEVQYLDDDIIKYKYVYYDKDEYNNPTKCLTYKNGELVNLTTVNIHYNK